MDFYLIMFAAWSLIIDDFAIAIDDDSDYEYLDNDFDEKQKPADVFWGDVLEDEERRKERNQSTDEQRSGRIIIPVHERKCSTEKTIMDKLLNGTGYSKYRLPCM